jgi:hypothetical protein
VRTLFVCVWVAGIVSLVAGLFVARQNWRPDVQPFGRQSRVFDIAIHPDRYATRQSLGTIRLFNLAGATLLASGIVMLLLELFRQAGA